MGCGWLRLSSWSILYQPQSFSPRNAAHGSVSALRGPLCWDLSFKKAYRISWDSFIPRALQAITNTCSRRVGRLRCERIIETRNNAFHFSDGHCAITKLIENPLISACSASHACSNAYPSIRRLVTDWLTDGQTCCF